MTKPCLIISAALVLVSVLATTAIPCCLSTTCGHGSRRTRWLPASRWIVTLAKVSLMPTLICISGLGSLHRDVD
jgi:hypothetical protein